MDVAVGNGVAVSCIAPDVAIGVGGTGVEVLDDIGLGLMVGSGGEVAVAIGRGVFVANTVGVVVTVGLGGLGMPVAVGSCGMAVAVSVAISVAVGGNGVEVEVKVGTRVGVGLSSEHETMPDIQIPAKTKRKTDLLCAKNIKPASLPSEPIYGHLHTILQ